MKYCKTESFFFFFATLQNIQDLSPLTRDQTYAPCGPEQKPS